MKKHLLILIMAISLFVIPFNVHAGTKKVLDKEYETKNLVEALAEEGIDKEFDNHTPDDNAITIYLFRGEGCGYCRAYLTFMNSITKEYGKYFRMVSFEVWNNEDNWNLMQQISYYKDGELAGGVPYIIIGDKVFPGYASSYDEDIKKAIKTLYDTPKNDRYDVFAKAEKDGLTSMEELEKIFGEGSGEEGENANTSSSGSSVSEVRIILLNLAFVTLGATAVILFTHFKLEKISEQMEENKNQLEELKDKMRKPASEENKENKKSKKK